MPFWFKAAQRGDQLSFLGAYPPMALVLPPLTCESCGQSSTLLSQCEAAGCQHFTCVDCREFCPGGYDMCYCCLYTPACYDCNEILHPPMAMFHCLSCERPMCYACYQQSDYCIIHYYYTDTDESSTAVPDSPAEHETDED